MGSRTKMHRRYHPNSTLVALIKNLRFIPEDSTHFSAFFLQRSSDTIPVDFRYSAFWIVPIYYHSHKKNQGAVLERKSWTLIPPPRTILSYNPNRVRKLYIRRYPAKYIGHATLLTTSGSSDINAKPFFSLNRIINKCAILISNTSTKKKRNDCKYYDQHGHDYHNLYEKDYHGPNKPNNPIPQYTYQNERNQPSHYRKPPIQITNRGLSVRPPKHWYRGTQAKPFEWWFEPHMPRRLFWSRRFSEKDWQYAL
jgi:hypothetical protein